jgi:hypothetical protein
LDAETIETGQLDLDFLSIVVLSGVPGLLPPQVIPFDVTGVSFPPSFATTANITLIPGQPMTVITTIGGKVDGLGCFDVTNTTIQCDATVEPEDNRVVQCCVPAMVGTPNLMAILVSFRT